MRAFGPRQCDIRTRIVDEGELVHVSGELTLANVADLLSVIDAVADFDSMTVLVDLSDVTLIDASAWIAIGEAGADAEERGCRVVIQGLDSSALKGRYRPTALGA